MNLQIRLLSKPTHESIILSPLEISKFYQNSFFFKYDKILEYHKLEINYLKIKPILSLWPENFPHKYDAFLTCICIGHSRYLLYTFSYYLEKSNFSILSIHHILNNCAALCQCAFTEITLELQHLK